MRIFLTTGLCALTLLSPASSSYAQQPAAFRAGLKSFTIPAPSSDLVETGSDYRVLLEPLAPTANRLIAAFIQPADLENLHSGGTAKLDTYALVEVPRRAEFSDVTPDQFKEISESMASQFGASVTASIKDQQDEINRRLKALHSSSGDITLDKPVQLGTLFSKPDASAYGLLMSVSSNGKTRKMVMGMTILRVQARVVFVYTYTEYKDDSTVQWVRTTEEHWADAILECNK